MQRYLVEASLPIYILHQLGIVLPGFFIIRLDTSIAVKFALVLLVAVTSTLAVYHFVVRPAPAVVEERVVRPAPTVEERVVRPAPPVVEERRTTTTTTTITK